MAALYRFHKTKISIPTASTVSFLVPSGAKEFLARLDDSTVDWSFGDVETEVTAGDGFPFLAGEAFGIDGPMLMTTLYFRHSGGTTIDMHLAYLHPIVR